MYNIMIKLGVLVLQYISCGAVVYVDIIMATAAGHVVYLNTCMLYMCMCVVDQVQIAHVQMPGL